jgi:FtsH-binding integral membrane protein
LDLKIAMNTQASFPNTLRRASAFLPIVMSLFALGIVLTHIVLFGTARQPDEGTAAHLWQLLMAGQLPIVLFFAFRWLPRAPRYALLVLALQAAAAVAALAPVYILHW